MGWDFDRCIKAICSEWDWDRVSDSMDRDGNRYHTYYIKAGDRRPEKGELLAIAQFLGWKYSKGYFYEKII